MFVPKLFLSKYLFIVFLINIFENVFESTIVLFQNSVFSAHVQRIVPVDCILETRMSKSCDRLVRVIHTHQNAWSFKIVSLHFYWRFRLVIRFKNHSERAGLLSYVICGSVLISKGVSTNNYWLGPSRDKSWNIFNDDWLTEHGPVKFVTDCSIRTFPHLLQLEFSYSGFVRGDSSAFNSHFAFLDSSCSVEGYLVIGLVSVLHTQIKVLNIDIEVRVYEFVLYFLPDDSSHFVAIHVDDWVLDFDLCEGRFRHHNN